jgi:hypothetical protein
MISTLIFKEKAYQLEEIIIIDNGKGHNTVKKRKAPKTAFKKGVVNNPTGRPKKACLELQVAKEINKDWVNSKIASMLRRPMAELVEIAKDVDYESIDCLFAKIIVIGWKTGSHSHLTFLLDRLIGKVKDQVDISMPEPYIVESVGGDKRIECGMKTLEAEIIT